MLRPLEKKKNNRFLYFKIAFLIGLIAFSLYVNNYFYNLKKSKPEVLSASKENKEKKTFTNKSINQLIDQGKKTANDLKQKGEELSGYVLGVVEDKTAQITTQSAKIISDFVFDNTLGNIIKQVERLPKKDQEKIKEYLYE